MTSKTGASGFTIESANYTLLQPNFVLAHCQGLTFTYSASFANGTALANWMWYDPSLISFYISPTSNFMIGTYNLSMNATLVTSATYQQLPIMSSSFFSIEVIINTAPTIDPYSFDTLVTIYAHHNWNVTAMEMSDDMDDTPGMDCDIVVSNGAGGWTVQPIPAWFTVNNVTLKSLYIQIKDAP